ncbi:endonuclease domain-containing protein [bacterium]|nr:MAG: endonuclease domain-containing protein [bacterium]
MHIARKLRRNQTPWEIKLWNALRDRNIQNLKFRRQTKIGNYYADFLCVEKKLIIELDGGHHDEVRTRFADNYRQKFLEANGYRVLRFWNNEIDKNLEGVIERIMQNS